MRSVAAGALAAALAAAGVWLPGPLGHAAAYAALAFVPGWAAAVWLLPRASSGTHVLLGVVLAPLVSTAAAWALLTAGVALPAATRLVALAGVLAAASTALRRAPGTGVEDAAPRLDGLGWTVLIGAMVFVALPPALSEWARLRSDGWIHAAIAWDIHAHGIPPVDPRFAGLPLNYVWFYNLLLAMLATTPGGGDPFVSMAIMNVVDMGALVALVWRLAGEWGGGAAAARGAVLLAVLGMNAGAWLLAPLRLIRALRGEHRGWDEAMRLLQQAEWDTYRVQHTVIAAPFAWMVNSWDKWTVGSSIGYTYLFVPFHLWALLRAWRSGGAGWWALAALSATAMILFHGVVGLSVLPVTMGALLVLAAGGRWLRGAPPPRQPLLAAGLIALGAAAALPYLRSITAGWDAGQSGLRHSYLQPGWEMPWTLATSCGVAALFAWGGLRRDWRQPSLGSALLPVWLAGMTAFSLVVHLPENNETKFVWQVFVVLAVIGGGAAWEWASKPRRGAARAAWVAVVALVFLAPSGFFLQGLLRDRAARSQPELAEVSPASADEQALHRWVREQTPVDAVFVDSRSRDHLMVTGRRRLLAGTLFNAARAAFPVAEMDRRRGIEAALYGPLADPSGTLAALRDCLRGIREVHPVSAGYVVFRRAEHAGGEPPWERLRRAGDGVATVYDEGGFVVLRVEVP